MIINTTINGTKVLTNATVKFTTSEKKGRHFNYSDMNYKCDVVIINNNIADCYYIVNNSVQLITKQLSGKHFDSIEGKITNKKDANKLVKNLYKKVDLENKRLEDIKIIKTNLIPVITEMKNAWKETKQKITNEKRKTFINLTDKEEILNLFFSAEIHPAPQNVAQLKSKSGYSWAELRAIYK